MKIGIICEKCGYTNTVDMRPSGGGMYDDAKAVCENCKVKMLIQYNGVFRTVYIGGTV